jgi:hypothetical protein
LGSVWALACGIGLRGWKWPESQWLSGDGRFAYICIAMGREGGKEGDIEGDGGREEQIDGEIQ